MGDGRAPPASFMEPGESRGVAVDDAQFARLLAPLGPFETAPTLAVGVSGGRDSLALTLLADRWARAQGGRVEALTVDHALRPESAAEAAQVGRWLAARGISHTILTWTGAKPATGLQAAARQARYDLLAAACRAHGILHLCLAHHREDQAETVALRQAGGSGVEGLAGMAAARALADVRLLRPLLTVSRADLGATCRALGQPWIDDPSNLMERYARGRLRRQGVPLGELLAQAAQAGRARSVLESGLADAVARHVLLAPEGYAVVDVDTLGELPRPVALRLLAGLAAVVGGQPYLPPMQGAERLLTALPGLWAPEAGALALTLAGTQARRLGGAGDRRRLLLLRQAGRMAPPVPLTRAATRWDGRFQAVGDCGEGALTLGALGSVEARRLAALDLPALVRIPKAVWPTLPALRRDGLLVAVPHLAWTVEPLSTGEGTPVGEGTLPRLAFRPLSPLAPPPFLPPMEAGLDVMAVVSDARVII
ncbi:tRNA lysidine(34) synthetase TilS [Nitrospirillum viridazoti]|uniref:tRNA(Ile)-lysidine synthase n=1 Tax=Nitrospirillum viridazoti CBAmc TaxID=1441467 RepID=A0A248JQZ6_9PROT|nr:tRNA lysidine(34) synthetase TilS [Nitrospirillum amazonense]ASG21029.1 tRNA lysidine(34) synthetase TilS [Nitrospirillum amazonense CBAmc]TWB32474.1 tRNA(Ile)-lysidine synthase [Nitrospirillum amazonense]